MPYLDQLSEIFGYFWDQINWDKLSSYYPYAIIAISCFVFLYVLSKFIQSKRRVKEYLEDRICLKVNFSPMGNKQGEVKSLLSKLYKLHFENFNRKYYFALEIVMRKDSNNFFLILSRNAYERIVSEDLLNGFTFKDVSADRERFFNSNQSSYFGLEAELSKDFIYPLHLTQEENILPVLKNGEIMFFQLMARPQGDKWKNLLDKAIELQSEGKSVELSTKTGCFTGFLQVVAPFFSFLGDTITFTVHGSSSKKLSSKKGKRLVEDETVALLKEKRSKFGFETYFRVLVKGSDEERNYLLLDRVLDMLESEGNYNSYVVDKTYTKPKKSFLADTELANLSRFSVDILSSKEIVEVITQFLSD
jgi:hypothetical protein